MTSIFLADESATQEIALKWSWLLSGITTIYLEGELGVGKTHFVRALLQGLGHQGTVRSPSFTLVEPYVDLKRPVYHFDFYRVKYFEELEYIGLREAIAQPEVLCLIEWPDLGGPKTPPADLRFCFSFSGTGRMLTVIGKTAEGIAACENFSAQ